MEIISRKDARERGEKWYFTGNPCKHGHVCKRWVSSRGCTECLKIFLKKRQKTDYHKIYYRNNTHKWALDETEKNEKRKYNQHHYNKNKQTLNENHRVWCKTHAVEVYAYNVKKRAKKMHRTPAWLTKEQHLEVEGYYRVARTLTLLTGVQHHVDHIYPLQGKTCSGLHVPWNLRVVTAEENLKKRNKMPQETL